ncbi:MAG: TonB family protein [Bdellovibrionales bacterium]|nr:TonB family protein [Bdellovibrionales bacterium]
MSTPRYVVSTTFRGRTRTETWDADAPLMIGRTERGPLWVIENTDDGKVRVRSLGGEIGTISNAHSQVLQDDQIKKGVQVKFKKRDSDEIKLEIRTMRSLHPKFYREGGGADFSKGFVVYHCVGDWNTESTRHPKDYLGTVHGQSIFRVIAEGQTARIIAEQSGLAVEVNGHVKTLEAGKEFPLSATEFFKSSVRFGHASWYFSSPSDARKDALFEIPDRPYENRDFLRYASGAMIALLLFFGITAMIPKPEKEEVIPPQILKVLITKQTKTKKAQETPVEQPKNTEEKKLAGEKNETKEKALAMSEEVAKPAPPDKLVVPKGKAGEKKSPAVSPAKVARAQPPKAVNRASNLFQGLLRNGLTKIVDNKQLLETAKLGSGGLTKGSSKSVAGALANLSIDMNAGGGGDKNSKVSGFGGDDAAGVRGPATAGYSNGVKGVISAGGGGDGISLGTGEAEVEEGLTKEEVGRVIHAHMKEVRYCYESSMVRASKVDGRVVLDFTINGRGVVAKAKVSNSSLPDPALGECIQRRLRTWQFPLPKGGVNVDVAYPFIFKTLGG